MIVDGPWRAEDTPMLSFKGKRRLPRVPYDVALRLSRTLDRLRAFDPHIVGALPLGLAIADSNIRVVCHAPDTGRFAQAVSTYFHDAKGFRLTLWTSADRAVVARFESYGWPIKIFGSNEPVHDQTTWRHFDVERRLLALDGEGLRVAVMALRADGLKTEPAFAAALNLAGDPYAAIRELYGSSDAELLRLLGRES
jgi:hypothetical protein